MYTRTKNKVSIGQLLSEVRAQTGPTDKQTDATAMHYHVTFVGGKYVIVCVPTFTLQP